MKATRSRSLAALAVVGTLALSACGSDNGATKKQTHAAGGSNAASGSSDCATGSIAGAGSTFQQNMEQQWISDFSAKCSGAQINYQGIGSGAGIQQFSSGTIDFAGSDVAMKPDEQAKADARCGSKAIHIPVTAGGIAVIYHLKGVDNLQLSAKTLAGIFQGTISTWNDASIRAENPGTSLPSTTIAPFHRSDGSGTTSVFSGFLDSAAKGVWTLGTGKVLQWPGGQGAKGSDGVTAGVKQTDGGITYAEVSFAKANSLPTAKIKGAGSTYVELTAANVSQALQSFSVTGTGSDLAGKVNFTDTSGYPISTVTYVIVCSTGKDASKTKLLKAYLSFATGAGQSASAGLGYAPLPAGLADKVKSSIDSLS